MCHSITFICLKAYYISSFFTRPQNNTEVMQLCLPSDLSEHDLMHSYESEYNKAVECDTIKKKNKKEARLKLMEERAGVCLEDQPHQNSLK